MHKERYWKKPLESAFNLSSIRLLTVTRYYNIEQARKVLRYEPVVPLKEGIRKAGEARPDYMKEVKRAQLLDCFVRQFVSVCATCLDSGFCFFLHRICGLRGAYLILH
jgi:hypothetical protein